MTAQSESGRRRSRLAASLGVALVAMVVLGGVAWYFILPQPTARSPTTRGAGYAASSSLATSSSSSLNLQASLLLGSPPMLGSPNAPVTIVEFGDYQCTTCGGWYRSQEASLIKNLVDAGKAKLVWRDFDYFGPDSVSASKAAYAAGEQGKFWQFHDLLFQSQQAPNNGWASKQNLETLARQLGLNMTLFDLSFNSGKYDSLINANHSLGVQAGVSETPTFFLIGPNSKMVTIAGGQPESVFEQAVATLSG